MKRRRDRRPNARLLVSTLAAVVTLGARGAAAAPTVEQCLDASETGQELRDHGQLSRARDLFVQCSSARCPALVRTSCAKWLEEVIERMPSIVVVARDEGDEDVIGTALVIDGVGHGEVSGKPITLDPGPHTIVVTASGYERAEQKVIINVGEKNRFVRFKLARASTYQAAPATAGEPSTAPTSTSKTEAPRSGSAWPPPALTLGLGGLALAGAAVSLGLGLSARSELGDLESSPCAATRSCDAGTIDDLRMRFLLADVSLGVAAVAAAAAIVVWITSPRTSATSAMRAGRLTF